MPGMKRRITRMLESRGREYLVRAAKFLGVLLLLWLSPYLLLLGVTIL